METASLTFKDDNNTRILPSHSHWRNLRNVLRAISLFKRFDAVEESDLNILLSDIERIPSDPVYRSQKQQRKENSAAFIAIQDLRREDRFFRSIERGSFDDLNMVMKEIEEDPYRCYRDQSHPFSLVNKRNRTGQTPLYVACKNGQITMVALLLSNGADPLIYSDVEGVLETNLQVAARWGHNSIVEKLLRASQWSAKSIYDADQEASTEAVKKLLRIHDRRHCTSF